MFSDNYEPPSPAQTPRILQVPACLSLECGEIGKPGTLTDTLITEGLPVKVVCWAEDGRPKADGEQTVDGTTEVERPREKSATQPGMETEKGTLHLSTMRPVLILMCESAQAVIDLRKIDRLALGKDIDANERPDGNLPMLDDNCVTLILDNGQMVCFSLPDVSSRDHLAQVINLLQESAGGLEPSRHPMNNFQQVTYG